MKRILSILLILALAMPSISIIRETPLAKAAVDVSSHFEIQNEEYIENEVIVTYASPSKPTTDSELTVEKTWNFGKVNDDTLYVSQVSSEEYSTEELMEKLKADKNVLSVEPNYTYEKLATNDTYYNWQWYLDGPGFSSVSKGIQYSSAPQLTSSKTPIVAIVDTGVDYTHEDLAANMWRNPYPSLSGTYGYDFGSGDSDPMDVDKNGHGTHCAGIISAATNNSKGITGINSQAKIMALKVFPDLGQANTSLIVDAFNYIYRAKKLGANIVAVNCSWGNGTSTSTLRTLMEKMGESGLLFVFAAGNSGINHDNSSAQNICPYDMDNTYTVTVGASTPSDTKASFSDYGATTVDLFAPGSQILSTLNQPEFFPSIYTAAQRANLCSYYNSCDDGTVPIYTPTQLGGHSNGVYLGEITTSTHDFTSNPNSGSLHLSVNAFQNSSTVSLYLDVTDLNLDTSQTYYTAYDLGMQEGVGITWAHFTNQRSSTSFTTIEGRTYLRIVGLTGNFLSISSLYFDNISISKANANTASFGKYGLGSGTSMAAPSVSAAISLLAQAYPNDTATLRKKRLLACVRTASGVTGFCRTNGILDLSKITSTTVKNMTEPPKKVSVQKVKLNKKKATLRYGKKLKLKATITPTNATNKKVKWYSSNKKYAKVTQKGVVKAKKKGIGKTVKIYAKAKDGSGKKAYCKIKIKKKKKRN